MKNNLKIVEVLFGGYGGYRYLCIIKKSKATKIILKFKIMANVAINIANGSTYKTIESKVKGNTFLFMQVSGKSNYVSITKLTNNPFVTAGRMFHSWEQAETKYASADMHIAIFSAKSIFNS